MQYEGPIYRPPSEAHSLLVQATVGCPHNKCSFCMVYKKGPRFKIRPLKDIKEDLKEAADQIGPKVRTLFFPAGNTMAMPTADLARICGWSREMFANLERITVYASMPSIEKHGPRGLAVLKEAGLTRLHVGLESGHAATLARHKKGTGPDQQVRAGTMALEAGLEMSLYLLLGLGGAGHSQEHAAATSDVVNRINQAGSLTLRLRTLLPKQNTLLLHQINKGRFRMCSAHQVLEEIETLLLRLEGPAELASDHYTNYIDICGKLPSDRGIMLNKVQNALTLAPNAFRPIYVGTQ